MKANPLDTTGTKTDSALGDLFPQLSPQQLIEVEEALDRYLELAPRIYERLQGDPEAYSHFKSLTASKAGRRMVGKGRSNLTPNST